MYNSGAIWRIRVIISNDARQFCYQLTYRRHSLFSMRTAHVWSAVAVLSVDAVFEKKYLAR